MRIGIAADHGGFELKAQLIVAINARLLRLKAEPKPEAKK